MVILSFLSKKGNETKRHSLFGITFKKMNDLSRVHFTFKTLLG